MKSFVISLVFFITTVGAVFLNCIYVKGELTEILDFLNTMPQIEDELLLPELCDDARLVSDMWQDALPFLALSVEKTRLRDVSVALGNLRAFCESDSLPDYNAARSDCIIRIQHLLERESKMI